MIPCITEPVETECCIADLCFQCRLTLPDSVDFAFGIKVSNYFVVISLFAVGIWNILAFYRSYKLYRNNDHNNYFPVMRLNNIIYAIGTGIFGLCKIYFQLSKPLLIFAAIHNLCEWVFVSFAFHKTKQQRMYSIFGSTCFILIVIGSIINVFKEFDHFALVEQTTGIAMDFMLPPVWFVLYIQNRNHKNTNNNNKETSSPSSDFGYMYLVAFIAHSIHLLFTIIPLVIVNFVRNQNETFSRLLEFVLFLSVPLTHILYTHFTSIHERYVDLPAFAKNDNQNDHDNEVGVYSDNHSVQIPSFSFITNSFRRMLVWYIVFVIVGLFPTIIIPAAIMKLNGGEFCPEADAHDDVSSSSSSSSSLCPVETGEAAIDFNLADNDYIIGTSTAHIYDGMSESFEYYLKSKDLVENARNFEGNLFYYLNKDMSVPNTYYIVEAWESREAVETWIQDPKVGAVFNNFTYNMMKGGQLELNGYVPLNPPYTLDENIGKGAIRHTFTSFDGCNDVGNAMLNASTCEYIPQCDHVELLNEEKGEQMLVFNNGMKLHCFVLEPKKVIAADGKITYSMIHQCENAVTERYELYEFPDEPEKCHVFLRFAVDVNWKTVDQAYEDYTSFHIPYVQKKYELSVCGNTKQNKSVLCQM